MSKPRFGLHWINAMFFIGFGAALVWARLPTAAGSQLPTIGMTTSSEGYLLIAAGILMLLTTSYRLHLLLTFALMPYTIAAFILFFENQTAQSMSVFSFVQVALVIIVQANEIIFRGK